MKIQTKDLTGAALDWAVAEAAGYLSKEGDHWMVKLPYVSVRMNFVPDSPRSVFSPSTRWAQGGPLIEQEWIEIVPWPNESDEDMRWRATQHDLIARVSCCGPTPLIAAMRCYVASKLGDEVEVPEELA